MYGRKRRRVSGRINVVRGAVRAASRWLLLLFALGWAGPVRAQTGTVEGRVHSESGSAIAAVTVRLTTPPDTAAIRTAETDALGRFRFTDVPSGTHAILVRRIGYEATTVNVRVAAAGTATLDIVLRPLPVALPGVSVEATRERTRFEQEAGVTVRELVRTDLKRVPGVAEADVLRAIEILPGVVSTSDYTSAFNVRGGSADQNLILLDGIPIYNPFHLGGLFSVFNADMVSRAELMAGGFPAKHGGRVSSVLLVESDASGTGTTVDGAVSLLAARAAIGVDVPDGLAGGLGLQSARARLSLRRSYFDQLFRPFFEFPYHLTDLQAFVEGWTAGGSRLTLTAYTGRDVLDFSGVDSFPLRVRWNWGNDMAGVRWLKPMGGGRTLDLRAGYTRFHTDIRFPEFSDTQFRSRIGQLTLRLDHEQPLGGATLDLGLAADRLGYDNLAASGGTVFRAGRGNGWLLGAYGGLRWDPGGWRIELSGRVDAWPEGARDAGSNIVAAPRLAVKRFLGDDAAVKLALGRYTQFVHSIRDEELPIGIDVWVLAGDRAPRTISDQIQAGIEAFRGEWFVSLEAYHRRLEGVTTNNLADDPNDPADDLIGGTGHAYGADLFVRRETGVLRPMVALSWLRARRTFADPASGIDPAPMLTYAPIWDRRIDLELALQAELPGGIEASARWNLGTGLPYTRPLGAYTLFRYGVLDGLRAYEDLPGSDLGIVLGPRNGERFPTYHRLDLSFRRTYTKSWGELRPYVNVVNVYNRKNPLFYFYEYDRSPARRSGISMFPLLPTIGLEVSFR